MRVEIDGWAWLDRAALSPRQVANIVDRLTIQPRNTSDVGNADPPPPLHLYALDEARNRLGVPRGFYRAMQQGAHEEVVRVGYGAPMQPLATTARFEGPFAEQAVAVEALLTALRGEHGEVPWGGALLQAQPAFGKALAHGEPVLTERGWVSVEQVSVGDRVAGIDGRFHAVTGVYPQGERMVYRVTFTDGTWVDCDGDHLWTLVLRRKKGRPRVDVRTEDLAQERLRKTYNGVTQRQFWLPENAAVEWTPEDLPVDPYTMGVFLGNGHWRGRSLLATILDREVLDGMVLPPADRWMREKYQNAGKATTYRCSPNRRDAHVVKSLAHLLIDMGLGECDSHSKFIPAQYLRGASRDRLALLQGMFDTDGSPISSGLVEYSTVSQSLALGVQAVVYSIGGTCVLVPRRTRYTLADGSKSQWFSSFRLTVKLPRTMAPFRLARKQRVVDGAAWQRTLGRAVDSVVMVGLRLATCIAVDSPDHLYLTRNCVPTHNTVVGLEVARRLGRRTLIMVHQEFLLNQWRKRIAQFLPGAVVGIIQQDRCEYARTREGKAPDFVIALLQSLARDEGGRYPQELYGPEVFGLVCVDEVHRISAATWCGIMPKFEAAYRVGLSATLRRKDGAEGVFFHHIAPITYQARTETVRPRLRRIITGTTLRGISRGEYKVAADKLNSAQIVNQLCADATRTRAIVDDVVAAVRVGRKVLVASARLDHLRDMMDQTGRILRGLDLPFVPILDAYTGEWFTGGVWEKTTRAHRRGTPKTAPRTLQELERAESANVLFATTQLVMEGFDVAALDVLELTTPVSDVEQLLGRIRRRCVPSAACQHYCPWRAGTCQGKPPPIVVDVVDEQNPRLRAQAGRRMAYYRTCCDLGGR